MSQEMNFKKIIYFVLGAMILIFLLLLSFVISAGCVWMIRDMIKSEPVYSESQTECKYISQSCHLK